MRLVSCFAASIGLVSAAICQVWEKTVAPGLTYRMEWHPAVPRAIHAFRYSPASPSVKALPELAGGTVYENDDSNGRETISSMVARTGAIAGINADFFPFTGNPLGLMVREGELLSVPVRPRSVFAWGGTGSAMGFVEWSLSIAGENGTPLVLDGINDQCDPNWAVINTPSAGLAVAKLPASCAVIRVEQPLIGPMTELDCEVESVITEVTSVPVGPKTLLLMGHGTKAAFVNSLRPGQKLNLTAEATGMDWTKHQNAVGGGPMLVQNGRAFVDWEEQGFRPEFANGRHPRTAIGRSKEGDIWFVTVDGRQDSSAGATLEELAAILVRIGCVDAINLDGGGSSAMNLFGLVLNRPTDGRQFSERKVANGVIFHGVQPVSDQVPLKIVSPPLAALGTFVDVSVANESGGTIPNSEVIWSSSGSGFVDQGGRLHAMKPGITHIAAFVRGQILAASVTIEGLVVPKPEPTPPQKTGG